MLCSVRVAHPKTWLNSNSHTFPMVLFSSENNCTITRPTSHFSIDLLRFHIRFLQFIESVLLPFTSEFKAVVIA